MDKFGYYFAGGIKTYSKLEARKIGGATFHFNDEVFSSIDTTKEPDASLSLLYMERAKQIRQKYDYVVIMYSGGSDSNNLLDAFIAAECKIDEICTTWDRPTTGLAQSFHNAEITNVVLPRIKEFNGKYKIRVLDITSLTFLALNKLGNNFEYFINHHMSPNNVAKHFLREHEYTKDWRDMIATGKKLVLVWGCDKPELQLHNNKWSFSFCDRTDNCVGPYTFKPGWYDELFYWTPDMPEIVIKQAHVVKNQCTEIPSYNELKCIIYPTWNRNTFVNGKSWSMVYSQRDEHFLKGNVEVERYHQIVDSYYNQLGDITPKNKRNTLWPMYTRKYEI